MGAHVFSSDDTIEALTDAIIDATTARLFGEAGDYVAIPRTAYNSLAELASQAIEARRAASEAAVVDESAVPKECAPKEVS